MEGKTGLSGQQGGWEGFRLVWDGAQGQCLLTGIGADGDAVVDGSADQLVECFAGLEVEVLVLGVAHEEPLSFEQPSDAFADGVQKPSEFGRSRLARAVKPRPCTIE